MVKFLLILLNLQEHLYLEIQFLVYFLYLCVFESLLFLSFFYINYLKTLIIFPMYILYHVYIQLSIEILIYFVKILLNYYIYFFNLKNINNFILSKYIDYLY